YNIITEACFNIVDPVKFDKLMSFRAKIAINFKLDIKYGDIYKTIYQAKYSDYLLYYGKVICYILVIQLTNVNMWKISYSGLLLELKMSNIKKHQPSVQKLNTVIAWEISRPILESELLNKN
ncbi:MAG: hypothetical protein ACKVKJ_09470, partial [Fidelibacterota bacterium]